MKGYYLENKKPNTLLFACAPEVSVSILSPGTSYTDRISRVSLVYPNEFRYSAFKRVTIRPFEIPAYPLHITLFQFAKLHSVRS
jgi:hypothetical protein